MFQKSFDNFEIEYKICQIFVSGTFPPYKGYYTLTKNEHVLCSISKLLSTLFWNKHPEALLCEKLKNGIKILIGQTVLRVIDQDNILHIVINNSITVWSTGAFVTGFSAI